MFGIGFAGHPDLRNMYLPTEFEGYPLRKDFPLLARMVKPWPGIVDVEPMPAEEAPPEDAVAGELAPENPVPDQADAGLGEPPRPRTPPARPPSPTASRRRRTTSAARGRPAPTPAPPASSPTPRATDATDDRQRASRGDADGPRPQRPMPTVDPATTSARARRELAAPTTSSTVEGARRGHRRPRTSDPTVARPTTRQTPT